MLKKYYRFSLCLGIPGVALQMGGFALDTPKGYLALTVAGTVLLTIGLAYYAKAKGRHRVLCLTAFLSIIGVIILLYLRDNSVIDYT